jgi:chromosome segregation ATPase
MMAKQASPADDLRNNATHIRQVAEAIAEAERQRTDAIAADDFEIAKRVDKRLIDLRGELAFLKERRGHLSEQAEAAANTAAEQARIAGIDQVLDPHAARIAEKAAALEAAVTALAAAWGDLEAATARMYADWPDAVPKLKYYEFRLTDVKQRLAGAMQYASASGDFHRLPVWVNTFAGRSTTLTESVRRALASYLADLRAVPLPAKEGISQS